MLKNNYLTIKSGVIFIIFMVSSLLYADIEYTVKSRDNLSRIVNKYYQGSELSRSQILIGILAKNPAAFKGGNINYLKRGRRLTLPDENKFTFISNTDASELLARHARFFKNGVTGNLRPPFSGDSASSDNPKTLESRQAEKARKISQLEKESEELRARLEKLVAEKTASDEKFQEVENALKKSLNQVSAQKTTNK